MGARRYSYREVVASTEPLTNWSKFVVHPVADRVLWLLANFAPRVHPNALTLVALGLGLAAAPCYARGSAGGYALGAALFYASFALDTIDGALARLTARASRVGALLDAMVDFARTVAASIALPLGAYRRSGDPRALVVGLGFVAVALAYYYIAEASIRLAGARAGTLLGRSPWRPVAWLRALGVIPVPFGLADFEGVAFVVFPLLGRPVLGMLVAMALGGATRVAAVALVVRRVLRAPDGPRGGGPAA